MDGYVQDYHEFVEYEERLGHVFVANGIREDAKKHSILLNVCGA